MSTFPLIESLFRFMKKGDNSLNYYISRTLLDNIHNIEQLTISDVSKLSFCSKASIVRFCKVLKLEGYRELSKSLSIQYQIFSNSDVCSSEFEILTLKNSTNLVIKNIKHIEEWGFLNIIKAARIICQADNIYSFGEEVDFLACEILKNYLKLLEIEINIFPETCINFDLEKNLNKNTTVIIFCHSGQNSKLMEIYEKLIKFSVQIIFISSNSQSPMYSSHNTNIITLMDESNNKNYPNSVMGFTYIVFQIINLIYNNKSSNTN